MYKHKLFAGDRKDGQVSDMTRHLLHLAPLLLVLLLLLHHMHDPPTAFNRSIIGIIIEF